MILHEIHEREFPDKEKKIAGSEIFASYNGGNSIGNINQREERIHLQSDLRRN